MSEIHKHSISAIIFFSKSSSLIEKCFKRQEVKILASLNLVAPGDFRWAKPYPIAKTERSFCQMKCFQWRKGEKKSRRCLLARITMHKRNLTDRRDTAQKHSHGQNMCLLCTAKETSSI